MRKIATAALILGIVALFDSRIAAQSHQKPGSISKPSSIKLTVAAIQMRSCRSSAANLAAVKRHLAQCVREHVRVAVLPECALTGYFDNEFMNKLSASHLGEIEREMARLCRETGLYVIAGVPVRDGAKFYNSAVVFAPDGRVIERYYKMQLAEKWPTSGDHLSTFKIDGIPCSIIICHDERYPELVRLPVLAGARVIFYLSHESGVKSESKIAPYRAQIQARAVENTVYVVHANAPANDDSTGSHGQSRLIAPDGNIIREATIYGDEVVSASLDMSRATGNLADRSTKSRVLGDWWKEGVKRVRVIE